MKKLFFLLMLVAFTILSCEKSNENFYSKNNDKGSDYLSSSYSHINPYDWVGVEHNDALTYVANNSDILNTTDLEANSLITEYFSNKYPNEDFPSSEQLIEWYEQESDLPWGIKDYVMHYEDQLELSINQMVYINLLDSASLISNIESFDQMICNIETQLYNDDSISNDDKYILWGAIAICTHSSHYWYNARNNENHPWHIALECPDDDYTGTWLGEKCADVRGWFHGLLNEGHQPKHNAASTSRMYVATHCDN